MKVLASLVAVALVGACGGSRPAGSPDPDAVVEPPYLPHRQGTDDELIAGSIEEFDPRKFLDGIAASVDETCSPSRLGQPEGEGVAIAVEVTFDSDGRIVEAAPQGWGGDQRIADCVSHHLRRFKAPRLEQPITLVHSFGFSATEPRLE